MSKGGPVMGPSKNLIYIRQRAREKYSPVPGNENELGHLVHVSIKCKAQSLPDPSIVEVCCNHSMCSPLRKCLAAHST